MEGGGIILIVFAYIYKYREMIIIRNVFRENSDFN